MGEHVSNFEVLFTAQKLKKFKTWQDGTMKYYSFNKKLVLTDEKGYNIDKKFSKTGEPSEGDEVEFDGHIVTVESYTSQEPYAVQNMVAAAVEGRATPTPAIHAPMTPQPQFQEQQITTESSLNNHDYRSARKRLRTLARPNSNSLLSRPREFVSPQLTTPSLPVQQGEVSHTVNPHDPTIQLQPQLHDHAIVNFNDQSKELRKQQSQLIIAAQENSSTNRNINSSHDNNTNDTILPVPDNESNVHGNHLVRADAQQTPPTPQDSSNTLFNQFAFDDKAVRAPSMKRIGKRIIQHSPPPQNEQMINNSPMEIDNPTATSIQTTPSSSKIINNISNTSSTAPATSIQIQQPQRRVRVGLSKRTNNAIHNDDSNSMNDTTSNSFSLPKTMIVNNNSNEITSASASPFFVKASAVVDNSNEGFSNCRNNTNLNNDTSQPPPPGSFKVPLADGVSIPIVLQFPTKDKALSMASNRVHLKRTKIVPTTFRNHTQYRDVYQKIIHEHLQILLLNYGVFFYMIHKTVSQKPSDQLERNFRSKGLGFYASCEMQRSTGRVTSQDRYRLKIRNREHHSKYGKDDIWVISKNSGFDAQYTFLAKSTFYGPFSDGYLEVECLTARDTRVASRLLDDRAPVYALRSVSASNEYMMLDALQDKLEKLPLLPYILYDDKKRNKKTKNQDPLVPIGNLEFIRITREDNIDIGQKLHETIQRYHLNDDQQSVLRQVAKSVIVAPNWSEKPDSPVTLVHGVFGSGKSYLAAVIIIFLRDIVDSVNGTREPDDLIYFRILIYSITNVAVDRILLSLDKLGYDSFVRVGSLKKIAKSILPYTIRAKSSSNEELKELEQMLEDPLNSEEDIELIASTIQKFRRSENTMQLQNMDVVGTTCMASTFDIFGNTSFSLALVDEASQLTEPISMVPLTRFSCSRLIMIGDPLQLPPTVTTTAEEGKAGQGLDKTLFDRMTELGHPLIMLRTQYRCHPDISSISNHLFYSRQLLDGISNEDRKPLIDGLPSLMFVDVGGQEQRNLRSNSFWNETEASIATYVIDALMALSISPSDIGVITLYKEQADKMIEFIGNNQLEKKQSVQVSTVDAFQGGEKEVIILSTVRTTNSSFIDNYPRVNVAVTRARRHLIILGKQTLLLNNDLWGNIVMRCQDNSLTGHDFAQLLKRLQLTNDSSIH